MKHKRARFLWAAMLIGLLAISYGAQAQTAAWDDSAPQFLYRNGKNLVLVNALNGEAETLSGITVADLDLYYWSADGRYLLVFNSANTKGYRTTLWCLNIYSLAERKYRFDNSLSCNVIEGKFSHDGAYVAFSSYEKDSSNAALWLYSLNSGSTSRIYETAEGSPSSPSKINYIRWSPRDHYMTFNSWDDINNGTNNFHVFNSQTKNEYILDTGVYDIYAYYDPLWSPDEMWFLLDLNYVAGGLTPDSDEKGDLYLVRSNIGEIHRLTYTPVEDEYSPHWTKAGQISYTVMQNVTLGVDDALKLQAPDTIVEPLSTDVPSDTDCNVNSHGTLSAQICASHYILADRYQFEIDLNGKIIYQAEVSAQFDQVMIGWRPVSG